MIITKKQIKLIETLHKKAALKARSSELELCNAIIEAIGISGNIDYFPVAKKMRMTKKELRNYCKKNKI